MAPKVPKAKKKDSRKFPNSPEVYASSDDEVVEDSETSSTDNELNSDDEDVNDDEDISDNDEDRASDDDSQNENVCQAVGKQKRKLSEPQVVFGKRLKKKEAVTILICNIPAGMDDAGVAKFFKSKGIEVHGCRAKYDMQKVYVDVKVKDCERTLALDEQKWCGNELAVEIDELEKEQKRKRKELKTHKSQKDNRTLCVKNLPFTAVAQQIEMLFQGVEEVRILTDYDTATRGIAFVQFDTKEDMEKALSMKNSFKLEGRKLRLDPCGKLSKHRKREKNPETDIRKHWGRPFERGSGRGRAFEMERMKARNSYAGKSFTRGESRGRGFNRGRSRGRGGFGRGRSRGGGRGSGFNITKK